jgi:glutaredoxin/glutathione-dependent peroxiredoxin
MSIAVGDTIPNVDIKTFTEAGPTTISTHDALGSGVAVLFAVPGAFTPTCSDYHLPSYVLRNEELRAKGVSTIACLSVNDPFVMGAWGRDQNVGDSVLMLADGNGEFTKALGLEMDGTGFGLGIRSRRFAMIIEDGVVKNLFLEEGPGIEASGAENILAAL